MDAITMLTDQHTKVRTLFAAFEQARGYKEKAAVFEDIADELSLHTTIEEQIFYPVAYSGESEALAEALEQHEEVKRRLMDLLELEPTTDEFAASVRTLRAEVERHLDEEERNLFPRAQGRLSHSELSQLGVKMEVLFTREVLEGAARNLAARTTYAPELTP